MLAFLRDLDFAVLYAVNGLAGRSEVGDTFVTAISKGELLKGGFVMALWWGLWFATPKDRAGNHEPLIATILLSMVAVLVGRGLQLSLPFRLRPLHDPGADTNLSWGLGPKVLETWSSMPSDHAVLYFSLAAGLFHVCRAIGVVAFVHAALWVSLPRIYLGLHYPSDIVVGAMLGGLIGWLLMQPARRLVRKLSLENVELRWPQYFYPVLFLVTFQITEMYGGIRLVGRTMIRTVQMIAT